MVPGYVDGFYAVLARRAAARGALSMDYYCWRGRRRVSVDLQDLEVVNNAGNVKRVRPQDIRGKRNSQSRRAFVVDTQQNQLEVR